MSKFETEWSSAPLPPAKRAYGMHINVGSINGAEKVTYGNGRFAYVRDLNKAQTEVYAGHLTKVNVVNPSPDGIWMLSGDDQGNVKVWAYPQLSNRNELRIGQDISDARWTADSGKIVAAGDGSSEYAKTVRYDATNQLGKIDRIAKKVLSVDYNPKGNRIATADEGNEVLFYQGPPFKYQHRSQRHTRFPNVVRFSPDGAVFGTAGSDAKVNIYDGMKGEFIRVIDGGDNGHKGAIYGFAWSADSKQFATASSDKTVKIWDFESGTVVRSWTVSSSSGRNDVEDQLASLAWAPSGKIIVVSISGVLTVFDPSSESTEPADIIYGHQTNVTALSIDRANGVIYTGDLSGNVAATDAATGKCSWFRGSCSDSRINAIAVNADGSQIFYAGLDNTVRASSTKARTYGSVVASTDSPVNALAAGHKDASLAVFVTAQGVVGLIRDGKLVSSGKVPQGVSVAISDDDSEVAIGGGDSRVAHIFKISGNELVAEAATPDELQKFAGALTYLPGGKTLVSTQYKDILIWNAARDAVQNAGWSYHTHLISSVKASPNGKRLLTACHDKSLIVWSDLETFKGARNTQLKELHPGAIMFAEWLDDDTIVTIGDDNVVKRIKLTL